MNLNTLPRDEMASHLAEIIESQDDTIIRLHQQQHVLWIITGIAFTWGLIF